MKLRVGRRTLRLTHLDKVMFPAEGLTKAHVLDYYRTVAPVMLGYTRGRPAMLHRFPDGITGEGWYQKDLHDQAPDWMPRIRVTKEDGHVVHPEVGDMATLLWLVNYGTIAFHVWQSRLPDLERPDRIVLDLDPGPADGDSLRLAVREVRAILEEVGLFCLLKTTGSRGFHVVAPIRPQHPFEVVRAFARDVARLAAARRPEHLTVRTHVADRGGRVFVDWLRNSRAQTAVVPYSLRALPHASVATPLRWNELDSTRPDQHTLRTVPERLEQLGDPWRGSSRRRRALAPAARRLADLLRRAPCLEPP